jgi:hypothetical protein
MFSLTPSERLWQKKSLYTYVQNPTRVTRRSAVDSYVGSFSYKLLFQPCYISEGPYLRGSRPFRRGGAQHRGIRKPCNQGVGTLSSIPLKS